MYSYCHCYCNATGTAALQPLPLPPPTCMAGSMRCPLFATATATATATTHLPVWPAACASHSSLQPPLLPLPPPTYLYGRQHAPPSMCRPELLEGRGVVGQGTQQPKLNVKVRGGDCSGPSRPSCYTRL